jgi:hypothetical protein
MRGAIELSIHLFEVKSGDTCYVELVIVSDFFEGG